jgi:ABC-type nitrate/sulfonate/bicarbonate transport system permease component
VAFAWWQLASSGELLQAGLVSFQTALTGFVVGFVVGVAVGTAMGLWKPIRYLLDVHLDTFNSAPAVALIPLIALTIGLGFTARAFVVVLFAFFPVVLAVDAAVGSTDRTLLEMGRSFGMSRFEQFRLIIWPSALPAVIGGARIGLIRAIGGVVAAEIFLSSVGLGRLMHIYGTKFRPAELFAIIFTIVTVALLAGAGMERIRRRLGHWQQGFAVE